MNTGNPWNQIHENERIKSCDEKHRRLSLEDAMLRYQLFRTEATTEKDAQSQIDKLWQILDYYYSQLPSSAEESDKDKTWRLFLARMDKRKMSPIAIEKDGKVLIELNPAIDPELKAYSEDALNSSKEIYKYVNLKVWSHSRLYNRAEHKSYPEFETNPLRALADAKIIWASLEDQKESPDQLVNRAIPSDVCTVLLRDFYEHMNQEDLLFCKDVVLSYGCRFFHEHYIYQIGDGTIGPLVVLPKLIDAFPEEKADIAFLLMKALMRNDPTDMWGSGRFCDAPISVVQTLWADHYEYAVRIYIGFIKIAQQEENSHDRYRQRAFSNPSKTQRTTFLKSLLKKSYKSFQKIIQSDITSLKIENLANIETDILITAFQLVPFKTDRDNEVLYLRDIISQIAKRLLGDSEEKLDYIPRQRFLNRYSLFLLHLPIDQIEEFLAPYINNFEASDLIADLLTEIVSSQDLVNKAEQFWKVWELMRPKIIDSTVPPKKNYSLSKVIESYMFARIRWKPEARSWNAFSPDKALFFQMLTEAIGSEPSYFYSMAKLLCGIGHVFIEDGIFWLSGYIEQGIVKMSEEQRENTIYYLETLLRRYILLERDRVRRTPKLKSRLILLLDHLIDYGSIIGYLLREDIV